MKKILFVLTSVFYLLLLTNAMSLPKCTGTYGSLLSFAWTNCYGKAELKDGATYEGEFYNEKAHGQGIYIFSNGDRVEGEFNNGVAHGFAIMTLANGNIYEGVDLVKYKNKIRRITANFPYLNSRMEEI